MAALFPRRVHKMRAGWADTGKHDLSWMEAQLALDRVQHIRWRCPRNDQVYNPYGPPMITYTTAHRAQNGKMVPGYMCTSYNNNGSYRPQIAGRYMLGVQASGYLRPLE